MAAVFPLGAPIWIDSTTPDPAGDTAFYEGLFGWRSRGRGEERGRYTELLLGSGEGRPVAGIMPGEAGRPGTWHLSFHVADCVAAASRAERLGGAVTAGPTDMGDTAFAMLRDPLGAEFGLLEPRGEGGGFKAYQELHAPSWFEYNYDGVPAEAMRFYADLLGWNVAVPPWTDPNDPRPYAALRARGGRGEFGGCHSAEGEGRGLPSQWEVMFTVADADETCAMAEELDGEIVSPPVDVPMLRVAAIRSPAGAVFGVMANVG